MVRLQTIIEGCFMKLSMKIIFGVIKVCRKKKNTLKNELEQKSIGEKNVPNVEIFTGQPDLPLCFLHGTFQDRN